MVCSTCKLIKRKNKKLSSMNKSCEKNQQHSQNILHVDVLYNIKRKKYKTVCAELSFANSPSTEWSWFCIQLIIRFLYLLCSWIIAIFKECLNKSRNSHCLYKYQVTLIVLDYFLFSNDILKNNKKFWLKNNRNEIKIGNRIGSVMVSVECDRLWVRTAVLSNKRI